VDGTENLDMRWVDKSAFAEMTVGQEYTREVVNKFFEQNVL
jgi:hypothetical protein